MEMTHSEDNIQIKMRLHLFDFVISPILLHGCELCDYENLMQIEVFHRNFEAQKKKSPSAKVYGDFDRHEMNITVWKRKVNVRKKTDQVT